MLRIFLRGGAEAASCEAPDAIWFDLENPTDEEEADVEQAQRMSHPGRTRGVEDSALLKSRRAACDGHAAGPARRGLVRFRRGDVHLSNEKLVTVRQVRPRVFEIGQGRASARIGSAKNGADVFAALIEGAAERRPICWPRSRDVNAQSPGCPPARSARKPARSARSAC